MEQWIQKKTFLDEKTCVGTNMLVVLIFASLIKWGPNTK
jgi:hypothetical protein